MTLCVGSHLFRYVPNSPPSSKKLISHLNLPLPATITRVHSVALCQMTVKQAPISSNGREKYQIKLTRQYTSYTVHKWNFVIFSDQEIFNLDSSDGFKYF